MPPIVSIGTGLPSLLSEVGGLALGNGLLFADCSSVHFIGVVCRRPLLALSHLLSGTTWDQYCLSPYRHRRAAVHQYGAQHHRGGTIMKRLGVLGMAWSHP